MGHSTNCFVACPGMGLPIFLCRGLGPPVVYYCVLSIAVCCCFTSIKGDTLPIVILKGVNRSK